MKSGKLRDHGYSVGLVPKSPSDSHGKPAKPGGEEMASHHKWKRDREGRDAGDEVR